MSDDKRSSGGDSGLQRYSSDLEEPGRKMLGRIKRKRLDDKRSSGVASGLQRGCSELEEPGRKMLGRNKRKRLDDKRSSGVASGLQRGSSELGANKRKRLVEEAYEMAVQRMKAAHLPALREGQAVPKMEDFKKNVEEFQRIQEAQRKTLRELIQRHNQFLQRHNQAMNDPINYLHYHKALSEGVEKDRSIRVNVVGNFGQGKTSLINALVGKEHESVPSTNGINISHYKYSKVRENIEFCSQDIPVASTDFDQRIAKLVRKEKDGNKSNIGTDYTGNSKEREDKAHLKMKMENKQASQKKINMYGTSNDFQKISKYLKLKHHDNTIQADGDIHIWDHGGQFIFYATHNLFLSKNSVYLLTFDLTKPLSEVIEDPEFPEESVGKSIHQYAEYWVRSIHTYVGSEDGFEPPVILVGTHKDKLQGDEKMKQKFADDYFDDIRKKFEKTPVLNHIHKKDFAVDCTNYRDLSIIELRNEIIRLGSSGEGNLVPARWIPLEKALVAMKHKKIITYSELVAIDEHNEFPLKDKEQIKLFLLYQHSKGNFLYFDEEPLSGYVALDTQYVIDAFRCIITSERFCKKDPRSRHLWKSLRQEARLEMDLIKQVWSTDDGKGFLDHRNVLLMLLQKLYIISEALDYNEETDETKGLGWYVVPCFLRTHSSNDALKELLTGRKQTLLKFCMSFNISPIVQIVYYRIIAALVGKWKVLPIKRPHEEMEVLLYENLGVFRLDRRHAGIVELNQNSIDLRVLNLCNQDIDAAIVDCFRRFVVSNVMAEFRKHRHIKSKQEKNPFEIFFKCNDISHNFDRSQQTVSLEDLKEYKVEPCPDMMSGHEICTGSAISEWYQDYMNIELAIDRLLEYKHMSKIAQTIGENWKLLGIELDLSQVEIDHITEDNETTLMRIYKMLIKWADQKQSGATTNTLIQAMKSAKAVTVDWDEVRNIVEEIAYRDRIDKIVNDN